MDFPFFHLDFFGNRLLIATIAIAHVLINHSLAVGFIPLITLLEYIGFKQKGSNFSQKSKFDDLIRKMMKTGFIITTSLGAMTGVGIWLSASLVNPTSIGSLIRVFYGAWFTEWIVFVLEVVFIMIYFLTWEKSNESAKAKRNHIRFGLFLSIFSWLTMAIIVAILGFMMDTGNWLSDKTFLSGVFNPLYLPQLYFRTPLAMMMAGAFGLFLIAIFARKDKELKKKALTYTSLWMLVWTPVAFAGGFSYYLEIPDAMIGNLPVAVGTMAFSQWYDQLLLVLIGAVALTFAIGLVAFLVPKKTPSALLVIPLIATFLFLGTFERIREFIRKPYVIGEYLYANAFRTEDYPLLKKDGMLKHSTYGGIKKITEENKIEAGKEIFMAACSRCHTVEGINSVVTKFRNRTSDPDNLTKEEIVSYVPVMHNVWFYMPEFPGNKEEIDALAEWIIEMNKNPKSPEGAQHGNLKITSKNTNEITFHGGSNE